MLNFVLNLNMEVFELINKENVVIDFRKDRYKTNKVLKKQASLN